MTGQRNMFRQSWQKRPDVSIAKDTRLTERVLLKFSFDVFNVTNTPSFDIPIDDVEQHEVYNETSGFYNCSFGLGTVNKTIGSAREIQMSLSLRF